MACDYWSSDRRRKGIHPQRARSKKESENNMEIDFSNLTAHLRREDHRKRCMLRRRIYRRHEGLCVQLQP